MLQQWLATERIKSLVSLIITGYEQQQEVASNGLQITPHLVIMVCPWRNQFIIYIYTKRFDFQQDISDHQLLSWAENVKTFRDRSCEGNLQLHGQYGLVATPHLHCRKFSHLLSTHTSG
jgi:hypothetical protein